MHVTPCTTGKLNDAEWAKHTAKAGIHLGEAFAEWGTRRQTLGGIRLGDDSSPSAFFRGTRQRLHLVPFLPTRPRKGNQARPLSDVRQTCVRPSPSQTLGHSAKFQHTTTYHVSTKLGLGKVLRRVCCFAECLLSRSPSCFFAECQDSPSGCVAGWFLRRVPAHLFAEYLFHRVPPISANVVPNGHLGSHFAECRTRQSFHLDEKNLCAG